MGIAILFSLQPANAILPNPVRTGGASVVPARPSNMTVPHLYEKWSGPITEPHATYGGYVWRNSSPYTLKEMCDWVNANDIRVEHVESYAALNVEPIDNSGESDGE